MNITLKISKKTVKGKNAPRYEITQSVARTTSIEDMVHVLAMEKELNKLFTEYNFQFDLGYR